MLKNRIILLSLFALIALTVKAQKQDSLLPPPQNIVRYKVIDGDTVFLANIREVYIFPQRTFATEAERRHYGQLVYNVKKVYPYAVMAQEKYYAMLAHLSTLKTQRQKREYVKQVEQDIKDNYEDQLKGLTITQGRILLKLIDRETGETSYALVKEFKGSFNAVFWQTLARIFGNNLKAGYDPNGDDKLINEIVMMIENGQL